VFIAQAELFPCTRSSTLLSSFPAVSKLVELSTIVMWGVSAVSLMTRSMRRDCVGNATGGTTYRNLAGIQSYIYGFRSSVLVFSLLRALWTRNQVQKKGPSNCLTDQTLPKTEIPISGLIIQIDCKGSVFNDVRGHQYNYGDLRGPNDPIHVPPMHVGANSKSITSIFVTTNLRTASSHFGFQNVGCILKKRQPGCLQCSYHEHSSHLFLAVRVRLYVPPRHGRLHVRTCDGAMQSD